MVGTIGCDHCQHEAKVEVRQAREGEKEGDKAHIPINVKGSAPNAQMLFTSGLGNLYCAKLHSDLKYFGKNRNMDRLRFKIRTR